MTKTESSGTSDRAMNREQLKDFRGALETVSKALDTFGDLFGYKNAAVEEIRGGYFKLGDLLYELDPIERVRQAWVVPKVELPEASE